MRIGYFLSCEEYTPAELVEQAQLAERAGFEALWISDHFHPWNDEQGQSPFVWSLIGAPDDIFRHETGKRWIPFYFGNDAQRMQAWYKGEGCLTYTGGNVFGGGGNELITITVDSTSRCQEE